MLCTPYEDRLCRRDVRPGIAAGGDGNHGLAVQHLQHSGGAGGEDGARPGPPDFRGGADGRSVTASFKTEPFMRGNQLQGLDVTDVTPGGAMDDYGLKKGDRIIEINGTKVGDLSNNDAELSKDQVMDAYRGTQPIVVVRDGQQVTLPANPAAGGPLNALNNSVKIPMH